MKNLKKYGRTPYCVAVIHGGPGARGEMAPVAQELAKICGVLEPLQTAKSINGQLNELRSVLKKHASFPVTLIGHSWGAWLSFIFATKYPLYVKKLILISSGPFQEKYASKIMKTRLSRLDKKEKLQLNTYLSVMNNQPVQIKDSEELFKTSKGNVSFVKFGELMAKTDSYKPMPSKNKVNVRLDILQNVWKQAEELRRSGKLLELAKKIKCPVLAIHGDYDPHPTQGVQIPLSALLNDFCFIQLKHCGHTPWLEKLARDKFFKIMKKEV
jgi:pimeloyl-ACP methyl ester carboxylesterase